MLCRQINHAFHGRDPLSKQATEQLARKVNVLVKIVVVDIET